MFSLGNSFRRYSTKVKRLVIPDSKVINDIDNNVYKFRKHPGIMKPKSVSIPESFIKAVVNVLADYPIKAVKESSEKLLLHLKGRHPPLEKFELKNKINDIQQRILSQFEDVIIRTEEQERRYKQIIENRIKKVISKETYNWKPVKYDTYNSLVYLLGRSAAEYAVLIKIFGEIQARDPDFKPKSLFDFGSGVGTATWAVNFYWKKYIIEYFNVDISRDMNDLAEILLKGGNPTGTLPVRGVFYRQFLPATALTYDIVVSAYSLFELPSLQTRLETIINLWNKTHKYLVIVEQGTNAGFKIINEIRDFLLQLKQPVKCTVFSPCPHDENCPRFLLDDGTPCNFEVLYYSLPISGTSTVKSELYTYIVFKKCKIDEFDSNEVRWPRVVRPTLVKSKHTICRMCTNKGKLEEVIFTSSKHGKTMYYCARSTKWGDLLPIQDIKDKEIEDINNTDTGINNLSNIEECKEK